MTQPPPTPRPTTADEAGRSCPYCRFALKQGASIVGCGACNSLYHSECWSDNGGCAIMGCSGAGTAGTAATTTPPAPPAHAAPTRVHSAAGPPPPPPVYTAPPAPSYPPPAPSRSGTSPGLILAVLVLALAVAGGATALVVSSKSSHADAGTPVRATVTTVVAQTPPADAPAGPGEVVTDTTTDTSPQATPDTGALPNEDQATMESDIQSVLLAHHEAITRGDYRAAWVLTSERYRAKKLREPGGYQSWAQAQSSLSRYLDPSGVRVSITDTDPRSGVATIDVQGMGWSGPHSSCSSWQGITWAKYENGNWRYEPGYSISDQRRAQWEPRKDELLGWGC